MEYKAKTFQWAVYLYLIVFSSCNSQTTKNPNTVVGGGCEGCEAIYEYGDRKLTAVDTLPKFQEAVPKLKITGTVYKRNGETPAENVILYIHHTNRQGVYEMKGDEKGWASRHGFIRGWIKTGRDGSYTFYTFRPASYPDGSEPEHIHLTVKEPDKNEYYLDDYVFDDDPGLTAAKRKQLNNRGGSGIMRTVMEKGMFTITRDIILGLHIPDYE